MIKEYKVVSSNRWGGRVKGKANDEGEFMHSICVDGHTSEPIDYKSKTFPEVGDVLKGEVVKYTSKAGDDRLRFETAEYKRKENLVQDRIMCQFALRLAVEYSPDHADKQQLVSLAKMYIDCVNELMLVKGE